MLDQIKQAELFAGMNAERLQRLASIGRVVSLRSGDYLFSLGESAQFVSVVTSGLVDLCCPISLGAAVKDIAVESMGPGKTVGWSALVSPYRFTLSARAAQASEVVTFEQHDLRRVFAEDPELERVLLYKVGELMANRLPMFQALWMRELLRAFVPGAQQVSA